MKIILTLACFCLFAAGCAVNQKVSAKPSYVWRQMTEKAQFPESYNYPVFVMNGEMRAINGGGWISRDGKNWVKTGLPEIGLNPAYQKYVQFKDAVYALGAMQGNYTNMRLSSKISRTRDFQEWETLAEKSNLPERVFYGATVFKDKIWLVGGWDGKNYYNDVWTSEDGVNWTRAAEKTAWTPRNIAKLFVFKDRLWFIGGDVIDGDKPINPNSGREVWTSEDGVSWKQVEIKSAGNIGGTPVVFDERVWLIGANRSTGSFGSAVFVSDDGITWTEKSAPWSPRGGTVVWVFGDKLFMTGGKFSFKEPNGEIKFVYSSDVWAMSRIEN